VFLLSLSHDNGVESNTKISYEAASKEKHEINKVQGWLGDTLASSKDT